MVTSMRPLSALGVVLLLSACGTTPPATTSPTASTATSPASESPTAASGTPPVSASAAATTGATTAATATTLATPAVDTIVLQPKGIDSLRFGATETEVRARLSAKAGKPDESYQGKVCEFDDATPYGRQLLYGGAAFLFQSKAKGDKNSPRTFTSWVVNLDQPLGKSMKLADGYPAETTFAKLKKAFPKGKLTTIALGESAVWVFTTPSGIWYRGDDTKNPTDVGAGAMGTCE
ncbi:hypothetical protein [Micropruina sp.]|uniref:hypothetical protein n=1 Tax=Micropruina sp. TaxID=2737536 RepID=UPI0039E329E6